MGFRGREALLDDSCARGVLIASVVGNVLVIGLRRMVAAKPRLWPRITLDAFPAFAVASTFECFNFIVQREVAHLLLGHTDFDLKNVQERQKVRRLLEFVADGRAAFRGYETLGKMANAARAHHDEAAEGYREFHRTRADAVGNFLTVRVMKPRRNMN
jgi:hypothetical protein